MYVQKSSYEFRYTCNYSNLIFTLYVHFYTGLEEWGLRLLKRFKWGGSFYDLNREVLDVYAACKDGAEVVAKQQEWMDKLAVEERTRDEYGRCHRKSRKLRGYFTPDQKLA